MQSLFSAYGVFEMFETPPGIDKVLSDDVLTRLCRDGFARRVVCVGNMIVDQGLDFIISLLGGGYGTPPLGGMLPSNILDYTVAEMDIRSGGVVVPAGSDVALTGAPEWTGHRDPAGGGDSIMTMTYPANGQVKFSVTIGASHLNGTTLTEEGLLDDNGNLIARTTFSKEKTSAFGLQLSHTITVARV